MGTKIRFLMFFFDFPVFISKISSGMSFLKWGDLKTHRRGVDSALAAVGDAHGTVGKPVFGLLEVTAWREGVRC